jgi:hypothetical protein
MLACLNFFYYFYIIKICWPLDSTFLLYYFYIIKIIKICWPLDSTFLDIITYYIKICWLVSTIVGLRNFLYKNMLFRRTLYIDYTKYLLLSNFGILNLLFESSIVLFKL